MTQTKNPFSLKYKAILTMLAAALFASCTNLVTRTPQDTIDGGGINQGNNSARGALTVTARVSNGASRYAMPTIPELVYAALLYEDGHPPATPPSEDFVQGTKATNSDNLIFSFQRPGDTSGTFTLEVFAFVKAAGESTTTFSRTGALLSGYKDKLPIEDDSDAIEVDGPIALSSSKQGTVNLQIKVPEGCSLEIDDTAKANFTVEGTSPNFTVKQKQNDESGLAAGAYSVTFTVKKGAETVHVFTEYINVINGLCTDTWSGQGRGEAKDVANSISKTVYVRGTGGWYETSTYNASDENSGSFSSPFATIQKAVDKIIAINDGSAYTIYIDGKLTQSTAVESMTNISPDKDLKLKIESLSADTNAILDAANNGRVMNIVSSEGGLPTVTLKNIHITGGYFEGFGGGIYVGGGSLTMESGTISGCIATNKGGGIYACNSASLTLKSCAIKSCETTSTDSNTGGGGICNDGATIEIEGGEISGCKTGMNGGGIFAYDGTFTMSGSIKISGNEAQNGGGVYTRVGTFTMNGGTVGGETTGDANTATYGGGVYVGSYGAIKDSTFRMKGGTIRGNNTFGVYINGGKFYMSDSAKVESNNRVYSPSTNPIRIAGALTATPPVATFDLNSYNVDRIVLRADDGVTIDEDICSKIALTDEGCKIVPSADGKTGVLKVHTIFLNSESGSDSKLGMNASTAVKTLSKAIEKYDTYNAEKIMVCAPYTLSGDTTLLNRTDKEHLTLMRYAGSSDGSGALTGNLLTVSQGNVDIVNTTLDGNKDNVTASGELLYISGSTTTVTLGTDATLCNNKTSQSGGAVYIAAGTFEMTGGAITGNTANKGGGVFMYNATLKMTGGAITSNEANEGGGVYNDGITFNMSGGTISGNEATLGSGVYQNGTFTMSAAAKVESDNDVYLCDSKTISAASNLSASNSVATITPSSYVASRKVLVGNSGSSSLTLTICNKFAVTPEADGTQWKVSYSGVLGGILMKRE